MDSKIVMLAVLIIIGIILISVGLYLIVLETKSKEKELERLREIEILKFKIKLSRPMILIVLGVVTLISTFLIGSWPLTNNSSQLFNSDTSQSQNKTTESKERKKVDDFSEIDKEEYVVSNDVRIFDLRSRFIVGEDEIHKKKSKVRQTRYTKLTKTKNTDEIRYRYATSGVDVEPRCLTHQSELLEKKNMNKGTVNAARKLLKEYELVIDVSNIKVGEEFLLICEADYWNAFQGIKSEWAGAVTEYKTQKMGILIIFSEDKSTREYRRKLVQKDAINKEYFSGEGEFIDSSGSVYWVIKDPIAEMTYEIEWDW